MPFPATPGWVLLSAVVGAPQLSWLRAPGAVPRHSWLGLAGGGGVWYVVCGVWCVVCGVWCAAVVCLWGCGWCVVWLVPRYSWRGSCLLLPATPGWVSLPVVVGVPRHSWLRVPGAVPRHSWLGFAVGGGACTSTFLAEGPGCGSSPLLAGVRWRRWCVVCRVWCVVRGVWCVVCGGCVSVGLWLVCGVFGPSPLLATFLFATPRHFWLGFDAGGGGRCVVGGVWCVACSGSVLVLLWLVCGVVGPSPLLAEVPVCYSPPLLAVFRCRWWWAFLATPG